MTNPSEMGEWMQRAGRLKSVGASAIDAAELSAVHAGLYPDAAPLRTDCRACLLDGWQAVLRYLRLNPEQQPQPETDSSLFVSPAMSTSQARFLSDDTQYEPFGSGTSYSNANMTDSAARRILAADPDADRLFEVLPADEQPEDSEEGSDEEGSDEEGSAVVLTERMHRDELEAIYLDAAPEGDAKAFANKADLIAAIEALSTALKPAK